MKTVAIAAAAAAALGLGAWVIVSDSGNKDAEKPTAARPADDDRAVTDEDDGPIDPAAYADPALARRVASLEAEVKTLRRQVAMMQGARAAFSPRGDADEADAPAAEAPACEIYEEERSREREERDERRRERMEERTEEILDELAADAGLDAGQREAISRAWSAEREKMFPMFQEARDGDRDFREVREEIEALHKATDAEVEKQLSADQYDKYLEARPRGPGRGGRGDDRGGRGDRGPRGG